MDFFLDKSCLDETYPFLFNCLTNQNIQIKHDFDIFNADKTILTKTIFCGRLGTLKKQTKNTTTSFDIIFLKQENEDQPLYYVSFFKKMSDILKHIIFDKTPVHFHFGFGKLTCGFLIPEIFKDLAKNTNIFIIRKKKIKDLSFYKLVCNDEKICDIDIIHDVIVSKQACVQILETDHLSSILKMLHIFKPNGTISTAVGLHDHTQVMNTVASFINKDNVFSFENLIESNSCFVDKICCSQSYINSDVYVKTEKRKGVLMFSSPFYHYPVYLKNEITLQCTMKKYILNFLHVLFAVFASDDVFDIDEVISQNKALFARLCLMVCIYLSKTHRIHIRLCFEYLSETLIRIRSVKNEDKPRLLRNLQQKYDTIFINIILYYINHAKQHKNK